MLDNKVIDIVLIRSRKPDSLKSRTRGPDQPSEKPEFDPSATRVNPANYYINDPFCYIFLV